MSNKHERSPLLTGLAAGISIAVLMAAGLWSSFGKFIDRHTSHEKFSLMKYDKDWSLGEYRECVSPNLKEQDEKPALDCMKGLDSGTDKMFKVSFTGNLTYDKDRPEKTVHLWLCRRNDGDPSFSCSAKVWNPEPSSTEPQDMDNLRKRNECEQRFTDRKIFEVDGMSIVAACKQNPDRLP